MNPETYAELEATITKLSEDYAALVGCLDADSQYFRGKYSGEYLGTCKTLISLGFLAESCELSKIWRRIALGWED